MGSGTAGPFKPPRAHQRSPISTPAITAPECMPTRMPSVMPRPREMRTCASTMPAVRERSETQQKERVTTTHSARSQPCATRARSSAGAARTPPCLTLGGRLSTTQQRRASFAQESPMVCVWRQHGKGVWNSGSLTSTLKMPNRCANASNSRKTEVEAMCQTIERVRRV